MTSILIYRQCFLPITHPQSTCTTWSYPFPTCAFTGWPTSKHKSLSHIRPTLPEDNTTGCQTCKEINSSVN
jgi:hypothetical protein